MLTNENLSIQSNGDTISLATLDQTRPNSAATLPLISKRDWVLLNVGGKHFMTTRSTLSKEESFLGRLCQCEPDLKTDVVSTPLAESRRSLSFFVALTGREGRVLDRSRSTLLQCCSQVSHRHDEPMQHHHRRRLATFVMAS